MQHIEDLFQPLNYIIYIDNNIFDKKILNK